MKFCQGCGSELLLQGQYQVIGQLESDNFSKKLQLNDVKTHAPKILKILINSDPKLVEKFQEEAKTLRNLDNYDVSLVKASSSNNLNNLNNLNNYFVYFPRDSKEGLHCLVMEEVKTVNLSEPVQNINNNSINNSINNSNNDLMTQTSISSPDEKQTSDDDFLWQQWALTSTVAIHCGFFIAFILQWILRIEIVGLITFVAILSVSQWFVLREHIKNARGWFLANFVLFGVPYLLRSLIKKQPTKLASNWVLANFLGVCIGFLGNILVENALKLLSLNEFMAASLALTVGSIIYSVITGRSLQKVIKQIIQ